MMIEPTDEDALLDRLRAWLRQARAEAEAAGWDGAPGAGEAEGPEVGLFRLVEEFTALRHEVKLQTKGARALQEQAEALLPALGRAIEQFRSVAPQEAQAAFAAARPLAEALADLDEALDRGRAGIEAAGDRLAREPSEALAAALDRLYDDQGWLRRLWARAYHDRARALVARSGGGPRPEVFAALLEGYGLIQARLRRAMEAEGLRRIACVGRPVDPERMTVVEVIDAPGRPPGTVVDEVRRGYTWRDRVLRYAEVRAARAAAPADRDDDTE